MRAVLLGLFVLVPLTLADLPERSRMALQALLDALEAAHLTHKEAYSAMRLQKSSWHRMLTGELHVPLDLVVLLPVKFQMEFWPRIAFSVLRQAAADIVDDVQNERKRA
jgi:hypothetical protein